MLVLGRLPRRARSHRGKHRPDRRDHHLPAGRAIPRLPRRPRDHGRLGAARRMTTVWALDASLEPKWRDYVSRHPHATLFHELAWRDLLQAAFKHHAHYLIAERQDQVVGVLPLVEVRSVFFGVSMVSVPFGVYGGVLADDPAAAARLAETARTLALAARRVARRAPPPPRPGARPSVVGPLRDVHRRRPPTHTKAASRGCPRKARAEVRKALAQPGVSVDVGQQGHRRVPYAVRGEQAEARLADLPGVALLARGGALRRRRASSSACGTRARPSPSVLSFIYRDTIMPYYSGATDRAQELSANNLMYFALMEEASRRGLKRFDFGRSRRDTGSYSFKKNQGFEPVQLHYHYVLDNGSKMPAVNPGQPEVPASRRRSCADSPCRSPPGSGRSSRSGPRSSWWSPVPDRRQALLRAETQRTQREREENTEARCERAARARSERERQRWLERDRGKNGGVSALRVLAAKHGRDGGRRGPLESRGDSTDESPRSTAARSGDVV